MISNLFNFQEKEILWIPVLTFENTENKPFTLADEKTSITVKKQGEFSISKVSSFDRGLFLVIDLPKTQTLMC